MLSDSLRAHRTESGRVLHVPFVDLAAQYRSIEEEIGEALQAVLADGDYILGRQVDVFETAFAQFVGVRYAVGASSGLDALRLALMALDISPGDEVILPANTYIATALAVSAVGAKPVLVDCDPLTYNIKAELVARAITPRTKAIIPVHLTGQPADMDQLLDLAARRGLPVIEDAAQAHGALHRGRPCGSLGAMGCFSFYPGKNLGAYGDGGMVTTNDARLWERLRSLRNYGQREKYEHIERGINARLDTLQAAVLNVKLRRLPAWNQARRSHAEKYRQLLAGVGDIVFQTLQPDSEHVYHLFVIETGQRDALRDFLAQAGVQTGVHYPKPIHLQKAYVDLGHKHADFPHTLNLSGRMISLPMYAELGMEQIRHICSRIRSFFNTPA